MSSNTEMVKQELNTLKNHLMFLYTNSRELHSKLLKKINSQVFDKKSWEFATYTYVKGSSYQEKNKYKRLYNLVCELEKTLKNTLNKD